MPTPTPRIVMLILAAAALLLGSAQVRGACCLPLGCMEITAEECLALGGTYLDEALGGCSDTDRDGDGVRDECDPCPDDPGKLLPGVNGCGVEDDVHGFALDYVISNASPMAVYGAFGIAIDPAGRMHVPEIRHPASARVLVLDQFGALVDEIIPQRDGPFQHALDLAVLPSGEILVTEWENFGVQRINRLGETQLMFGELGSEPGQFNNPFGITTDRAGNIYVADMLNGRVQVFDEQGTFLRSLSAPDAPSMRYQTINKVVVHQDRVYVTDGVADRVLVFDVDGTFLFEFGGRGQGDGQFRFPTGITVDHAGLVYVIDAGNERLQVFDASGGFRCQYRIQQSYPWSMIEYYGVVVDPTGRVVLSGLPHDQAIENTIVVLRPLIEGAGGPCPWDCAGEPDGQVDIDDLLAMIAAFNDPTNPTCDIVPDNGDGTLGDGLVRVDDLLALLNAFGPCP